ncbi:MAG: hypothetical protein MUC76_12120 [Spirochaetes bacterium]|jgi:hypothetical protein|nr:hypothetical protein [Spirochaetota bacterium]
MKPSRPFAVLAASICIVFVIAACSSGPKIVTVPMRDNLKFSERSPKIPLTIGLYLSPEAREYIIKYQIGGPFGKENEYRYLTVGSVLLPNARASLSEAFTGVEVMDSPGRAKAYYVELEVDPASSLEMGKFTFSEKSVDLHLRCKVKRGNGALLWQKVISSKTAKSNPMWWASGLYKPYVKGVSNTKLQGAAEESLTLCLEALNGELIKNKANIFR